MRILHVLDHGLPLQSGYTFRTRAILKAQMRARVAGRGGDRAAAWRQRGRRPRRSTGSTSTAPTAGDALPSPIGEWREIARVRAARDRGGGDDFRPDVLHAHSPVLDALAALRVGARARACRCSTRSAPSGRMRRSATGRDAKARCKYRATSALETRAVRRADAVAVICEGLRGDLVARGIDRGQDHGVAQRRRSDAVRRTRRRATMRSPPNWGSTASDDVVGFIGSFYDYEGLDDLIAAMPALVARAAERAAAAGRRRADGGGAARAGRGVAGRGRDPLRRARAARPRSSAITA